MKRREFVSVLFVALSVVASAQERRQGGPPPYDPAEEVTVSGTVTALESFTPPDQTTAQSILMIVADGAPLGVFLGPAEWVGKQRITFAPGTAVRVTGLRGYRFGGRPAMTPRLVVVGSRTLTVRDTSGKPAWEPAGAVRAR